MNNILLFLSSADIFLLLISNVVSGSLPQHVELARIIQTEVVKHNWSNNKLSRSRVRQILKNYYVFYHLYM